MRSASPAESAGGQGKRFQGAKRFLPGILDCNRWPFCRTSRGNRTLAGTADSVRSCVCADSAVVAVVVAAADAVVADAAVADVVVVVAADAVVADAAAAVVDVVVVAVVVADAGVAI
jgi:hypothetical protein